MLVQEQHAEQVAVYYATLVVVGLGAVLVQEQHGEQVAVYYASRSLTWGSVGTRATWRASSGVLR